MCLGRVKAGPKSQGLGFYRCDEGKRQPRDPAITMARARQSRGERACPGSSRKMGKITLARCGERFRVPPCDCGSCFNEQLGVVAHNKRLGLCFV